MKTRYIVGLFLVGASVLSSCSDFTEIDQKGINLLSTTDQLEMLLNQEYNIRIADIQRVCGSVGCLISCVSRTYAIDFSESAVAGS